jgi:hypothetical protein
LTYEFGVAHTRRLRHAATLLLLRPPQVPKRLNIYAIQFIDESDV